MAVCLHSLALTHLLHLHQPHTPPHRYPHIAFSEMLFFDNEKHNTAATAKLGVVSVHCPQGLSADAWEGGLQLYASTRGKQ